MLTLLQSIAIVRQGPLAVKSQIYKLERFIRYIAYFLAANGGILKSTYNRYEDGRILKIIRPNFDNFKCCMHVKFLAPTSPFLILLSLFIFLLVTKGCLEAKGASIDAKISNGVEWKASDPIMQGFYESEVWGMLRPQMDHNSGSPEGYF
ncbi:transmembrane protein, putative [Medicago truncatula]|uniref:Transmembrane protein, putative n=1 Tax=Medicago truncatula TaxID=3880 RepID=A0A072TMM5_MEDTR|nr:transmembrane protein, putative [Medicago truncatula]